MATTGQQVLDRAAERSSLNKASLVNPTQALAFIAAEQRFLFLRAAQLNPEYFGKETDTGARTAATEVWDLVATPGDVGAVTKLVVKTIVGTVTGVAVGDKVWLVSSRFPDMGVSPRAYIKNRKVYSYSAELGTGANYVSVLTVHYSELPSAPLNLTATLRLPDEWCILPEIQLARLFAIRDQRETEVQMLDQEYQKQLTAFEAHCLLFDHGSARPLEAILPLPAPARES